ncbi:MAG: tyrosine--tRNA ligase, partial [Bacteroidia bacterium]
MDKIDELLTRGVDKIYPTKEELETLLKSGKKLRVYQGFDPTSPELHIGHLLGLRKLRQWQDLGHEVIFLIGDFTGMIGDPTGKDKTRTELTHEQVLENAKTYKEQAAKILSFDGENPVLIKYNGDWLEKLSAIEFARLTSYFTIQQLIERDMFQKRLKNDMNIAMSEFSYPLMQAYDSVAMDVDVEIGGSDQMFNMMIGRQLMHKMKRKNKFVMTMPLLTDSEGKKIGKSEGNAIALTDKPEELYGKIMGLSDDVITKCLEYLTDVSMEEISEIQSKITGGENPVQFKKKLAFEIVKQLNDENSAKQAAEHFEKTVQHKETPEEMQTFPFEIDGTITDVMLATNLATSKAEAKRLIEQGGVAVDEVIVTDPNMPIKVTGEKIIRVGKRKFVKIKSS